MVAKVDVHALKFNQASIIVGVALAFALNQPWLVVLTCLAMAIGTAWPALGPFRLLYQKVFLATGLLKARLVDDDPSPHRFALGLGAAVLALSSLALLVLKFGLVGWILAALVAVLAGVNLFLNF